MQIPTTIIPTVLKAKYIEFKYAHVYRATQLQLRIIKQNTHSSAT